MSLPANKPLKSGEIEKICKLAPTPQQMGPNVRELLYSYDNTAPSHLSKSQNKMVIPSNISPSSGALPKVQQP